MVKSNLAIGLTPNGSFSDLCLSIYFSSTFSETAFITVNTGLYYLFRACLPKIPPEQKEQFRQYASMCRVNIDTALTHLPLYLPVTSETIVGLVCGVCFSLQHSEMMVLICVADHLCPRYLGAEPGLFSAGQSLRAVPNTRLSPY